MPYYMREGILMTVLKSIGQRERRRGGNRLKLIDNIKRGDIKKRNKDKAGMVGETVVSRTYQLAEDHKMILMIVILCKIVQNI